MLVTAALFLATGVSAASAQEESTIGDRVWLDLDADGVQDAGEPGVSNVPVLLYDSATSLVGVTGTDASGLYNFETAPGQFQVKVVAPAGAVFTTQGVGGDQMDSDVDPATGFTALRTIVAGANPDLDAGILPATLDGRVWSDTSQDGLQDIAEFGVPSVSMNLLNEADVVIDTTSTATDGSYSFNGLTPSVDYTVELVLPAGATLSPQNAGDDAIDSDFESLNRRVAVSLPSGVTSGPADAGLIGVQLPDATGNGIVWDDKNGDGVQNGNEKGLRTVDIVVTAADSSTFTVTTDASGAYTFTTGPGQITIDVDEDSLVGNKIETTGNSTQTMILAPGTSTTFDPIGYDNQGGGGRGGGGRP